MADFASSDSENKLHETEAISGFYEGAYSGTTKVICVESLDGDVLEAYFYFSVTNNLCLFTDLVVSLGKAPFSSVWPCLVTCT